MSTLAAARTRIPPERVFYVGMASAMTLVVYVGFARSFFLRPLFPAWPSPAEPIFYLHGAVFSAWCVLLVVQASLVAGRRVRLHRALGWWGAGLAGAMVLLGVHAALVAARRPGGFVAVRVPPLQFLLIPLLQVGLFGACVAIAAAKRRDTQAHKRWMLIATVALLPPALARWPGLAGAAAAPPLRFLFADLFLVALAAWDLRTRGALHEATRTGGTGVVLAQALGIVLSGTPAWLAVAGWLVRSPL